MGTLHGLQGFDHREFLGDFRHLALASHTRRIDQHVIGAVLMKRNVDGILCRAGHIKYDLPFLANQSVDQGGLTHVRTTDNGHADAVRFLFPLGSLEQIQRGQTFGDGFAQLFQAPIVAGGNHGVFGKPKAHEVRGDLIFVQTINFVDHGQKGDITLAQIGHNIFVCGGHPFAAVQQQQNQVGFIDGQLGLAGKLVGQDMLAKQTTRIDEGSLPFQHFHTTVTTVTGQPGHVRYQGISGIGQFVEKGRFSNVGSTHKGNGRQQGYLDVIL